MTAINDVAPTRFDTHAGSGDISSSDVGQWHVDSQDRRADIVSKIRYYQSERVRCIRMRNRIMNGAGAYVRSKLGWRVDMPEKERAEICKQAAKVVAEIIIESMNTQTTSDGNDDQPLCDNHYGAELVSTCRPFVFACNQSAAPFQDIIDKVEKEMRSLAKSLPVYQWVESIKGLGALGLAVILGEAGAPLDQFTTPSKLWKRLGVAPPQCYAMVTKDGRTVPAIPKRRRGEIWTITDSLLKKDNAYLRLYRERRLYEVNQHPEFDKGIDKKTGKKKVTIHCHRRSFRYAEKRMILDLWNEWKRLQLCRPR